MRIPERFRLGQLAAFADGAPDDLLGLSARLPGGLVHAARVWITPRRPDWLEPLSEGSQWYGLGRELVVVAETVEAATAHLDDLVAYHRFAARLVGHLSPDAVAAGAPGADLELAERLGLEPDLAAGLDTRAPGLRADLTEMARSGFDPEVRLHAGLRPEAQRAAGAEIAHALDARIPAGRFFLLVADSPAALELLSPYAADLGHSLYAWGLENPGALPEPGLAQALADSEATPERDLAAVVAQRLFATAGDEVRVERRTNEATQGLYAEDAHGAVWGIADLGRLEAPDPTAVGSQPYGVLAVVLGGSEALREATCAALAESGRLEGIALVSGITAVSGEPLIPTALTWRGDGARLEDAEALGRLADQLEVSARVEPPVDVTGGAAAWLGGALGALRRAATRGRLDDEVRTIVTLSPRVSGDPLGDARRGLAAARLALAGLVAEALPRPKRGGQPTKPKKHSQISRRFRA